ncbi:MAG: hypothetical protein ACREDL_07405, partial [Bradyrhizobium sp.]
MGGIRTLHRISRLHTYNRHFRTPDVLSQIMSTARVSAFNRRIKIPLRSIFQLWQWAFRGHQGLCVSAMQLTLRDDAGSRLIACICASETIQGAAVVRR